MKLSADCMLSVGFFTVLEVDGFVGKPIYCVHILRVTRGWAQLSTLNI